MKILIWLLSIIVAFALSSVGVWFICDGLSIPFKWGDVEVFAGGAMLLRLITFGIGAGSK